MKAIRKIVDIIYKEHKKDHDTVICIVGDEGASKSTLMLHIVDYYCELAGLEPDIKRIGIDVQTFKKALAISLQYGLAVFDEAGDGLFSRQTMSSINVLLAKTYMAIRGLNLLTILCLPDFFDLDKFFRKRRVRGLFQVYSRGRCKFFNKREIELINYKCENYKKIFGVNASIYDTFPKYKGALAKDYAKMKMNKILASQKELNDQEAGSSLSKKEMLTELLIRGQTVPQACKIAKVSTPYGYRLRDELGLKPSK